MAQKIVDWPSQINGPGTRGHLDVAVSSPSWLRSMFAYMTSSTAAVTCRARLR